MTLIFFVFLCFVFLGIAMFISLKCRDHLINTILIAKKVALDPSVLPGLDRKTIKIIRRDYLVHSLFPFAYTILVISFLTAIINTPSAHSDNRVFYQFLILTTIVTMFISVNLALSTLTITSKSKIGSEIVAFIVSLLWTLVYCIYALFVALMLGFSNTKWG